MISKVALGVAALMAASFSYSAFGEVPHTFLGAWEMDLERTFSIHMKEVLESHPDTMGGVDVEEMTKSLAKAASLPSVQVLVTITDKTITAQQEFSKLYEEMPYRVIGGNSGQVIVELFPSEGEPMISTIRLIDGGLALSQEDCSDDPQRCVRRQRAAMERSKRQAVIELPVRDEPNGDPLVPRVIVHSDVDEPDSSNSVLIPPEKAGSHLNPKWLFLKKHE